MRKRATRRIAWAVAAMMLATSLPTNLLGGSSRAEGTVVDYSAPVQLPWNTSAPKKPSVAYIMGDTALGMVTYSAVNGTYIPQGTRPTAENETPAEAATAASETFGQQQEKTGRVISQFQLGSSDVDWTPEGTLRVVLSLNQSPTFYQNESLSLVRLTGEGEAISVNARMMQGGNELYGISFNTDALGSFALLGAYEAIPETYTVTFIGPEGETVETRTVSAGEALGELPEAPAREGYTFTGWVTEKGAVEKDTPVGSDMTVHASYEQDYPATVADAQTEKVTVHVEVPEGALPKDARFRMTEVNPEDYRTAVEKALGGTAGEIRAVDMTFVSPDGTEYQPMKPVTVNVTLTGMENAELLSVVHIADNGEAEVVFSGEPETVKMRGASDQQIISFPADGFSVYAITGIIEQEVSIGGATYKITVAYDNRAGIPDGAALDVKEVSADEYLDATASTLGWSDTDEIFYTKFLDISIVKDGMEIEPKTPVAVTIELLDVTEGAEALEVVHFDDDGHASKVDAAADENGVVTFTTDSFSVFGFGSLLRSLLSWTSNAVSYTLQGFSALLNPTYTAVEIQLEEGLETISAYNVHSRLGSLLKALYVKVTTALNLGARESLVVYSLKDGAVESILAEGSNIDSSLGLGDADGFAVVKDSGFRRKIFDLGAVELNGMMPKAAEAEAAEADSSALDVDGDVLAIYDITIEEEGTEYQPDSEHPVRISIAVDEMGDGEIQVWHIRDDGEKEEIKEFELENGKVIFDASAFSVYAVVETRLTQMVNASDGNTYAIEVIYQNTAGIPMKGTALSVSELLPGDAGYDEYIAASAAKVGAKAEDIELSRVFDIRIVDESDPDKVYEPMGNVEVSIRLVGEALNDYANLDVLHFVEDENRDGFTVYDMASTVNGESVQFTTDSFSVYAVIGTPYLRTYVFYSFNEYGEYTEYPFYTDTGDTVFSQTIKNGESVLVPSNPTNPMEPEATFAGWYVGTYDNEHNLILDTEPYDFNNIPEITEDTDGEVRLYARFTNYIYVIFHDQYDTATGTFPVAYTVRAEEENGSATASIAGYSVVYSGGTGMTFYGWSYTPITIPGSERDDEYNIVSKIATDSITITDTTHLYPIFKGVHWITFYSGYSGSGATYYPDTYYFDGEGPATLADRIPVRNVGVNGAYDFLGWYAGATLHTVDGHDEADVSAPAVRIANADGSLVSDFTDTDHLGISVTNGRIMLTSNVTLYAAWETATTANYTISVYKQKASDEENADPKTYDYVESFILSGDIGDTISVDNRYQQLATAAGYNTLHDGAGLTDDNNAELNPYAGYQYASADSGATIAGNGSTVVHVYYDWITKPDLEGRSFTLTFADTMEFDEVKDESSFPAARTLHYGDPITEPDAPSVREEYRHNFSFTAWYTDASCTIRAFFDIDEYNEYDGGSKALYETMPGTDLTLYAGWNEEKIRVNIDPNYGELYKYVNGELVGTGTTYFNGGYSAANRIQEYTTVTRDYVESSSGTWYYVKHDRNYSPGGDRKTYYTQDPGEATEYTTFEYQPGIYRYAGWYEVFNYGQEDEYESDTPYVFDQPVTHETTIRLHWTKVGAFYLQYDAGAGTLTSGEDLETVYVNLDHDSYMDNAEVVVTRTATPPAGYEFAGWVIRGDESGKIYHPGESFTLLTSYAATVQGKKTVYLDAVYTKLPTATIVYHANGGVMNAENIDYGSVPAGGLTMETSYDDVSQTVTVSNLANNSQVYLSDGNAWLSMTNATFIGWCANEIYDPNDEDAPLLYAGTGYDYHVDVNGDADNVTHLYAVWQVSVKYHLNSNTANWGGDWTETGDYSLDGDVYTQNVYLGNTVEAPACIPAYTGSGSLTFHYWATRAGEEGSYTYSNYNFAQPVMGELDLYAYWAAPISVTVHAMDASGMTLAEQSGWVSTATMSVGTEPISLDSTTALQYITLPGGTEYEFAFATLYDSTENIQSLTDHDAAESIYYDGRSGEITAEHADGRTTTQGDGDELYFVFYEKKTLDIAYMGMGQNGEMMSLTMNGSQPENTVSKLGEFDMATHVTSPLDWQSSSNYPYYAFAIGGSNAANVSDLTFITNASDLDASRPALHVRNTWKGFVYSTDTVAADNTVWVDCGYDIQLYVVYYDELSVVVTFREETVGLTSDLETAFTYSYVVEESTDSGSTWSDVNTGEPVTLRNGEAYSVVMLMTTGALRRITITQTEVQGFTTTGDGVTNHAYTYTADNTHANTSQTVTFTNTRTSIPVEVHVALADISSGSIKLRDDLRSGTAAYYSFDFALADGNTATFTDTLPAAALFTGDSTTYAFGTVLYGTDQGEDSAVTVGGMGAESLSCALYDNEYQISLVMATDSLSYEPNIYSIYYLYYPMPQIMYMEELEGGVLAAIQGSTDGSSGTPDPTYNKAAFTLNGATVTQNQKFELLADGITIAQTVGSFRMPPLLDKWDSDTGTLNNLYLIYSKIGAGDAGKTSTADIATSEAQTLQIRIEDNKLQWRFDDGEAWTPFTGTPTVYAIYHERGYDLTITKEVPVNTGFAEPFTITITSAAINRSSYSVEGLGSSIISATPHSGETPGVITFTVTDGSDVTLQGMSAGTYTITESGHENHTLSAQVTVGAADSETAVITDNSSFTVQVDKTAQADLTNTPVYICKVGSNKFYTLSSAVDYIRDYSQDFSGTIEMLVDYVMPSSDSPEIPHYMNVTLTTASSGFTGSGASAVITRRATFDSGAMLTNTGTLTLQNVILDGNDVSASGAILDNEGTLTIGSGAVLRNGHNVGYGGAVNSWAGTVTVSDNANILGNSAALGGAIHASGGDVVINGGTIGHNEASSGGAFYYTGGGSVTVSGGSIAENSAADGGAIYMDTGTLMVSGGSMSKNTASGNGGAIYAASATVEISGGTIGGSGNGNTATSGGAVYANAGSVTVSGTGAISYNTASTGNGGAICVNTASVSITGGSITNNESAAGNGGAVYAVSGAVSMSGGNVSANTANLSGGGIYAESGAVTLSGSGNGSVYSTVVSNNTAMTGSGGGVYAGSGAVSVNTASLTQNSAPSGNGGGLYTGAGAATLTNASFTSNAAINGAAIFADTGSVTFSASSVTGNTASNGGAVGVGSAAAKLYLSNNVQITGNTMNDGESSVDSNVYLDQDSDAVINATGLGTGANVGIYVPDKNITVDGESVNLFERHGVPSAFFGTYTSDRNVDRFSNDRLDGLSVQKETTSYRLFWGKAFAVEVRYLDSYANGLPPTTVGTIRYTNNNYYAPSSSNAASEIAEDLYSHAGNSSAVFGHAFVEGATSFDDYITDVNWDSSANAWEFVKRDGTSITGTKLMLYYTLPAYISIENNTAYTLTVSPLTVELNGTARDVINSETQTGYGYVFATNGVVQNELRPVSGADLTLYAGKSIRILLPGGRNAAYSLTGSFTDAETDIVYRRTNAGEATLAQADTGNFTLTGKTLNNSNLYEIIFGGSSAICRIVTADVGTLADGEIASRTETANEEGKYEYTFSSLNQAVTFIRRHTLSTASIEMLVDYIIPGTDVVTDLPVGYDITFSTATDGTFKYSDDRDACATISRADGNNKSFIVVANGNRTTKLTVKNLIFDGKNFSGSIDGGVVKTLNCDSVTIDNVDFKNCVANNGGGLYIQYGDLNSNPNGGTLTVTNSKFTNCVSKSTASRQGGGAVWSNGKTMSMENCSFTSCTAVDQGGAVFHRIDGTFESSTTVTSCHFTGCSANAAGSIETDARYVTMTGCSFKDSTAKARNGGAFNVYALNKAEPTEECHVTVENSTFENCFALSQNGGGFRSTATHTTVTGCTFKNTTGNNGGAISISSKNAIEATVTDCTIDGGVAANQGGGIYCMAKTFTINGTSNTIQNCTATKDGGGIFHGRGTSAGASFLMSNSVIENCSSISGNGGGLFTQAGIVLLTESAIENCSTSLQGGGVYIIYNKDSTGTATLDSVTIKNCSAASNGGGLFYGRNDATLSLINGSLITGNTSGGLGGGVYTTCRYATFTDSSVTDNTAVGNGGGVSQNYNNYNNANGTLTLDNASVTGNTSGGQGGGVFTQASAALKNGATITGNRLSTNVAANAAGFYMLNSRTLSIGTEGADEYDPSTIKENYTANGTASSLRLPEGSSGGRTVNSNSVRVLCGLDGEIRVVNAAVRGTQFGESSITYPYGVSDLFHVFKADDDSLYGIINRQDETGKKIIWAADPICKITDDRGRMLFLDTAHTYPAVFDILDNGSTTASKTSPFGILRAETPELYTADGTLYTGSTYQLKMLVENYTATQKITTPNDTERTIIFTTAGSNDSLYPYRGRTGTRSTITAKVGNNALMTVKSNLTLTNIVLDGGSESGVTAQPNTRIINATNNAVQIKLDRNAALQNASTTSNGGGVLLNNGASLSIEGGTIRNCSAKNGGGVYKDGNGTVTMTGGSITKCTVTDNGGGIYLQNGTVTMSGGSIIANHATTKGGGIAVAGSNSRLYFSGAAYVYGNTSDASVASGNACNVEMNQDFNRNSLNPGTVIVSRGLTRGATVGVYVPGEDNNNNTTSLYDRHGDSRDPFGTYTAGSSTDGFHYFVNDRNGMKGGMLEDQVNNDYKVYWREIYSLVVSKQVLSDDPEDANREFRFSITLTGTAYGTGTAADSFNGTFENMTFVNGYTEFTLRNGESKAAVKLPLGFDYRVEEILSDAEKAYYKTTPALVQTGSMNNSRQYVYSVTFTNLHAVCKITDATYGLLYYLDNGIYRPAVYSKLMTAFNHLKTQTLYYKEGDNYHPCTTVNSASTKVEMLIKDYVMEESATFQNGTMATLATADPNAIDGFPYVGSGTAVITRGYTGKSMITVQGDLKLGDITLDGGSSSGRTANTDGGAFNVVSGGILTVGTGSTIRNSTTTQNGAGVYLAEGGRMNISGNPKFSGNTVSFADTTARNGNETVYSSGTAEQDIYIAGYNGTDAASLHVTGNLTGTAGSIWVWAAENPHYKQSKQFAFMDGGTHTGLTVFRNARTDTDTENPLRGTPLYLYGVSRGSDGKVYWSGGADLTITKTVTGDMGDRSSTNTFAFTLTVSGAASGTQYSYTGTSSGTLTLNSSSQATFSLAHGQSITIEALPLSTAITLTETHGYYRVSVPASAPTNMSSYTISTDSGGTNGAAFQLAGDATLDVTNDLPAVAPTGVDFRTLPFLIMLGTGLLLILVMFRGKRRREEE